MRVKLGIVTLTFAAVIGLILTGKKITTIHTTVCINEVRSTTASKNRDGYFGSDYIELYNASNEAISLEGWYLSDDESDLLKNRISNIAIPAKSYVVFYADGGTSGEENSLNFKISSSGEKIFLSDSEGELVDSIVIPELKYGEVYAREKDGLEKWSVMEESFLEANSSAEILPEHILSEPVFSHESGFYEEAFELALCCNFGEIIYYTLDGSIPTKESDKYKEPIIIENISDQPNVIKEVRNVRTDWLDWYPDSEPVDKAVVVRAISVDKSNQTSEVATKIYFVDLEEYKDENIISVVAEFDDLFGEDGIFVTGKEYDERYLAGDSVDEIAPNFVQSGRQWEVLGNLQILCQGDEVLNQPAGIRAYGGRNRYGKVKRMSFFARNEYSGSEYFENLILDNRKVHSMGTNSNIGNVILQQLVTDRSVTTQGAMRTKVFLNGEYYSDHNVMEKYSKHFFAQKYDVEEDNLIVIRDGEISEGSEEDILFYKWLIKQVETRDLSVAENYEEISGLMDIQSYIDYMCANIYLCNMDMSETKNYILWRSREDDGTEFGDGRFRWMLYDMGALDGQISLEYYDIECAAELNSFHAKGRHVGQSISEQTIYRSLKNNSSYCRQFVLSFMDMANVNFAVDNVKQIFSEWGFSIDQFGDFFENRFDYIVPYMAEEFGLTGTLEEVTLKVNDTEGGTIQLNTTMPDISKGSWTGKYYTDYAITATAIPEDGYKFVGWSGSISSENVTIEADVLEGGIILEAVFVKE